jgi:hypothetical protein
MSEMSMILDPIELTRTPYERLNRDWAFGADHLNVDEARTAAELLTEQRR